MWLPKEGKFILLFSNKISESGISAWATTRGRPYEIIFMHPTNNLLPSADTASRVPTVTYIETGIIIYKLPDTETPPLRTTASRQHSVNSRPQCADGTLHAAKPYFTALCAISLAEGEFHAVRSAALILGINIFRHSPVTVPVMTAKRSRYFP